MKDTIKEILELIMLLPVFIILVIGYTIYYVSAVIVLRIGSNFSAVWCKKYYELSEKMFRFVKIQDH